MIYTPPNKTAAPKNAAIFLAGSIEMGAAKKWQDVVAKAAQAQNSKIDIYNPRRDDWDSSWEQKIENKKFNEQVTWELDHIYLANIMFFYFDPATKSPISLMELGLVAGMATHEAIIVICPEGFWRKGNVDILCERAKITQMPTLAAGIKELLELI